MEPTIPVIVEELYRYFVTDPNPDFLPDYFRSNPIKGHGLWSFYQGLQLGMQLNNACLDQL